MHIPLQDWTFTVCTCWRPPLSMSSLLTRRTPSDLRGIHFFTDRSFLIMSSDKYCIHVTHSLTVRKTKLTRIQYLFHETFLYNCCVIYIDNRSYCLQYTHTKCSHVGEECTLLYRKMYRIRFAIVVVHTIRSIYYRCDSTILHRSSSYHRHLI